MSNRIPIFEEVIILRHYERCFVGKIGIVMDAEDGVCVINLHKPVWAYDEESGEKKLTHTARVHIGDIHMATSYAGYCFGFMEQMF